MIPTVPILAIKSSSGMLRVPLSRFLLVNLIGTLPKTAVLFSVGYFAGDHIDAVYNTVTRYITYFAIGVGLVVVVFIVRRVRHARACVVRW